MICASDYLCKSCSCAAFGLLLREAVSGWQHVALALPVSVTALIEHAPRFRHERDQ